MKKASKDKFETFGLANDLAFDGDGWATIPYGESRHIGLDARKDAAEQRRKEGKAEGPVIQRFDRSCAEALFEEFRSGLGTIKRALIGLPIYQGHPDATRFSRIWPDKTPRGTIADMEVTDRGLRIQPVLTEEGAALVNSGWSDFSPYWLVRKIGEENGAAVVAPYQLVSIGLAQKGNIPGLSLVNADLTAVSSEENMKDLIVKLLAAIGVTVAADADDLALANAVDTALPTLATATAAVGQLATATTERSALAQKLADAEKARSAAELALANAKLTIDGKEIALANAAPEILALVNARTTATTALATERRERATLLANQAVTEGRLPAAERDATVLALCNAGDFAAEAAKLAAREKALPTGSRARQLGEHRGPEGSRAAQVLALVNACMEAEKLEYEPAFARVQADPKHAELFAAMAPAKK